MSYLDNNGLSHLWSKIKNLVSSHTATVTQTLTSGTEIGSVDGTKLYAPSGSGNTVGIGSRNNESHPLYAIAGNGISIDNAPQAQTNVVIRNKPATTSSLGGVIVGDGLSVNSNGTISVSMAEEEVDAAVEAAFPAPTGYTITPGQAYVETGSLKAIGLSDEVSSGEFIDTAAEGETVYVLSRGGHWKPNVTIDSSGSAVSYELYGPAAAGGTLYVFTMPADAVTVNMWYND